MTAAELARVEQCLAIAHRVLWEAAANLEHERDQGAADDLYMIAAEIGRVKLALFGSGPRRRPGACLPGPSEAAVRAAKARNRRKATSA